MHPSTIILILATTCCLVLAGPSSQQQNQQHPLHQNHHASLARILRPVSNETSLLLGTDQSSPTKQVNGTTESLGEAAKREIEEKAKVKNEEEGDEKEENDDEDDEDDDDEDDGDADDEYEIEGENDLDKVSVNPEKRQNDSDTRIVTGIFGNRLKLEGNRTLIVGQSKKRDLGLLTLKALLLGPLIGITIKHALIRGLIWSVGAYLIHLIFPSLLTSLGLGTGLVGFARQIQPDYAQMMAPHLANLQNQIPTSFKQMISQYRQVLEPVVESVRSIPEGQCRYRAVCELAGHVSRQARGMSTTLQRISATVYLNFGTEYSKAWLDGIVLGTDCGAKYLQCPNSPLSMVAGRLSETLRQRAMPAMMQQMVANAAAASANSGATPAAAVPIPAIPVTVAP